MNKPQKLEIAQSDIDVLKLMIKHYEERGGGYSQKEALKLAIKALKACDDWEKWLAFDKPTWKDWEQNWNNAYKFFNSKGNTKTKSRLKKKWYDEFMSSRIRGE